MHLTYLPLLDSAHHHHLTSLRLLSSAAFLAAEQDRQQFTSSTPLIRKEKIRVDKHEVWKAICQFCEHSHNHRITSKMNKWLSYAKKRGRGGTWLMLLSFETPPTSLDTSSPKWLRTLRWSRSVSSITSCNTPAIIVSTTCARIQKPKLTLDISKRCNWLLGWQQERIN